MHVSDEAIAFSKFFIETNAKTRLLSVAGTEEVLKERAVTNEQPVQVFQLESKVNCMKIEGYPVFEIEKEGSTGSDAAIMYFCGGAYTNQPQPPHWEFADKMANELHMPVVVGVYPKAPIHGFDEAYEFLLAVYNKICREKYSRIFIVGDSSGGGLALGFTQWLQDMKKPMPSKLVLISPWLDITMKNPDIADYEDKDVMLGRTGLVQMGISWAKGSDVNMYKLSPINGNLDGLPPTLMIAGTHELFLPDIRLMNVLAQNSNFEMQYIEYPSMIHDFVILPIPEADDAFEKIKNFIEN